MNSEGPVGSRECRICQSNSTTDMIQSPCLCKGSMGNVHKHCLEKWLHISSTNSCELCSFKFRVVQGRHSLCQSVRLWLFRGCLLITIQLFILVLFMILWIGYSSVVGWLCFIIMTKMKNTFFKNQNKTIDGQDDGSLMHGQDIEEDMSVTEWVYFVFVLILMLGLSVFGLYLIAYRLILRNWYRAWYRVWSEPVSIRLVLDSDNGK